MKIVNGTGPKIHDGKCRFHVWAPKCKSVDLVLPDVGKVIPMECHDGNFVLDVEDVEAGTRYLFRLDGKEDCPDPASRFQPEGLHGPSEIVEEEFPWTDSGFPGIVVKDSVIYELHTGTIGDGTFGDVEKALPYLKELGITAIEIMPIAQFPGSRNWGYDGAMPYAIHNTYGGPSGFKTLVNAAHAYGIGVIVDVVYNHLGPEGNHLAKFGPYFSEKFSTPWGPVFNYDGKDSPPVREYLAGSMEYLIRDCHVDGVRVDASDLIYDDSALHFLEELTNRGKALGVALNKSIGFISECATNNPRYTAPPSENGYGFDAVWLDDFHHSLYCRLRGTDPTLYQEDYPDMECLARAYQQGYVYAGQIPPTRGRIQGRPPVRYNPGEFIAYIQNHDQIGNSPRGRRIAEEISFDGMKLAAGMTLLSPFVPMIFMGEEYREKRPFQFFLDLKDNAARDEAVRQRYVTIVSNFPDQNAVNDPVDFETFRASRIDTDWEAHRHTTLYQFYRELIRLRKVHLTFSCEDCVPPTVQHGADWIMVEYHHTEKPLLLVANFAQSEAALPVASGYEWECLLNSSDAKWDGPGQAEPKNKGLTLPGETFQFLRRK